VRFVASSYSPDSVRSADFPYLRFPAPEADSALRFAQYSFIFKLWAFLEAAVLTRFLPVPDRLSGLRRRAPILAVKKASIPLRI